MELLSSLRYLYSTYVIGRTRKKVRVVSVWNLNLNLNEE